MNEYLRQNLYEILKYENCTNACPCDLVDAILFHISKDFVVNRLGSDKNNNGLIAIRGQSIVFKCVNAEGRAIALKVAKPAINQSVKKTGPAVNDFEQILSIPEIRLADSAKIQASAEEESLLGEYDFIIPRVYDAKEKPVPWIAMAWVASEDILTVLQDKKNLLYSLDMFCKFLQAIGFLHRNGIVYRDCKSENLKAYLKITEKNGATERQEKIALLDFGLAKMMDGQNRTLSGTVLGTPPYASEKMLSGGADMANHLDDVHGAGFVLYEFVTQKVCPKPPVDMRDRKNRGIYRDKIASELSEPFKGIFLKATSNFEDSRFPNMDEFSCAVRNAIKQIRNRGQEQNCVKTVIEIPQAVCYKKLEPPPRQFVEPCNFQKAFSTRKLLKEERLATEKIEYISSKAEDEKREIDEERKNAQFKIVGNFEAQIREIDSFPCKDYCNFGLGKTAKECNFCKSLMKCMLRLNRDTDERNFL